MSSANRIAWLEHLNLICTSTLIPCCSRTASFAAVLAKDALEALLNHVGPLFESLMCLCRPQSRYESQKVNTSASLSMQNQPPERKLNLVDSIRFDSNSDHLKLADRFRNRSKGNGYN